MSRWLEVEPSTDAELFDVIHGLLGVGDWCADLDDRPYHRFRMVEISKIKSLRKKRGIPIAHLAATARWCYARQLHIATPFGLTKHVGEAMRERSLAARADLPLSMTEAATDATNRGQHEWADRLLRAQGAYRQEVLSEWIAARDGRQLDPR